MRGNRQSSGSDASALNWLAALQMAEAWGQHPADIMSRPGGVLWARRYRTYQDELHEIQKDQAKKAKG